MGCKTITEQVAEATAVTTLQGSDLFNIVRSETLNKITFDDFVTQLGVTGSLGDNATAGATPVLASAVSNNYLIRGLSGGNGASVQLDANDNIQVNAQINNAGSSSDGVGILKSNTVSTFELRRLTAGAGINVNQSGDIIEIVNSEVLVSSKTVIVSDINDFPAPVGGVITLVGGVDYFLNNDIATSNRFVIPDGEECVLRSLDRRIVSLQYTGSGTMFTCNNPQFTLKEIDVKATSGTLFDTTGSTTGVIELFKVQISAATLGNIQGLNAFSVQSVIYDIISVDGWTFSGAIGILQVISNVINNITAGVFLDFGSAVFSRVNINDISVALSSGGTTFLSGLAGSANIGTDLIAIINSVTLVGSITDLVGINEEDTLYRFSNCNTIADTRPDALGTLDAADTTTITVVNTPVVLNGTFTQQRASQMTVNSAGRITFVGPAGAILPITAVVSIEPVSGTNKDLSAFLYKNGVQQSASEVQVTVSSGTPVEVTLLWQDNFNQNDFYEIYLENRSDTTNITVNNCKFRVN